MIQVAKMSPEQKKQARDDAEAVFAEKAKSHLMWFTAATFTKYLINWHHKVTAKYLMRWVRKESRFLILTMPPRHGKTELASIRLPAFIFGLNPNAKIIGTSYGSELASTVNRGIQKVIDSKPYRTIFPLTRLNGDSKVRMGQALRNSEVFEIIGHRGLYRAAGIGGPITGTGADYLIVDDPIKNPEEADSQTQRDKVWNWFVSTALTRLEKDGCCLVIMTRWHEDDLVGRILQEMKKNADFPQFEIVNLEAVKETQTMSEDSRQLGEPLWGWKYNLKALAGLRAALGSRWWNALYQQRPTALEGGIFKRKWMVFYKELPKTFERVILSCDATFSKSKTSDYVVIQIWGKKGAKYYLLDQVRAQMTYTETKAELKKMASKWPQAIKKIIEKKANGAALLDDLQNDISGMVGYSPTESKESRANAVSPLFEAGNVELPDPKIYGWVEDYVHELTIFPNGAHDDQVDGTTQALIELHGMSTDWLDALNQ